MINLLIIQDGEFGFLSSFCEIFFDFTKSKFKKDEQNQRRFRESLIINPKGVPTEIKFLINQVFYSSVNRK